jgi:uncharacterized membrane protein
MHALDRSPPNLRRALIVSSIVVIVGVLTLGLLGAHLDEFAAAASRAQALHLPNLALFAAQSPAVQIHVLAALGAMGLGAALLVRRKGRRFHRVAGWTWTALISAVALSSLFIVGLNGDRWSYLHLTVGWIAVFLPLAVLAARRHRVTAHRTLMMMLFYGTLLISGALAFLPGRLLWRLFFA